MKNSKFTIDLILTNKPLHYFQNSHVAKTGLRDYHKMISSFLKAYSSKLRTKVIYLQKLQEMC